MKKRNLDAETDALGFEVAFETLGESARFSRKVETRNLKLDVGCGSKPTGDVNVDFFARGWNNQEGDQKRGEYLNPKWVPNFVVADASHLPFQDNSFIVVYSSHTIEHVSTPELMLKEMCRVVKSRVIIRCPHRKGSGAKRPSHLNYFDEAWFAKMTANLGYSSKQRIRTYDFPISNRLPIPALLRKTLLYRGFRYLERHLLIPFEVEATILKTG